jgi:hypothetical protein
VEIFVGRVQWQCAGGRGFGGIASQVSP